MYGKVKIVFKKSHDGVIYCSQSVKTRKLPAKLHFLKEKRMVFKTTRFF